MIAAARKGAKKAGMKRSGVAGTIAGIVVEGKGYKSKEVCDGAHAGYGTVSEKALSLKARTLNMEQGCGYRSPIYHCLFGLTACCGNWVHCEIIQKDWNSKGG